ncbi:MAG: ABC transporter permease [Aggregatilineales bacterium]
MTFTTTIVPNFIKSLRTRRLLELLPIIVTLILAVAVSSVLLILFDANPITAFNAMWQGAFGSQNSTAETLVKATPIMFVAIGITVAFRGGVINIGGEGQMIMGAVVGTALTLSIGESLGALVIPLALCAGFIAGGIYGGIAGFLKAYYDVNEILSTIMMNQIAVQLMNFLLNGPMLDPTTEGVNNIAKTQRIPDIAELPRLSIDLGTVQLFDRTRLHAGFLIALALAVVIYILLWKTTIGYRIRAVGLNPHAARYAGIHVGRNMTLAMFLAGGCAGIAGVVQVLALGYRLQTDGSPVGFTANAGFNGIVAALFGGLNPLGAIFSSGFFGALLVGANGMQRAVGVPAAMITAINGLIVIFIVSSQIFTRRIARQRLLQPAESSPVATPIISDPSADTPTEGVLL